MKKFISGSIISFMLIGCYDPPLMIKFINKNKNTIQVLTKDSRYIDINPKYIDINQTKLIRSSLVFLDKNETQSTLIIKKNNTKKVYDLNFDLIFTNKIHKLRKKYHNPHPPLTIEVGKKVYIVFPENERVVLLPHR